MIAYKNSNTKLIELIQIYKDLESKIKELKVYYILKNFIFFKKYCNNTQPPQKKLISSKNIT